MKKLKLDLILTQNTLGYQKIICAFLKDNKTGGFALGLSTGRGSGDEEKAVFEALINYFFGHCGKSESTLRNELKESGVNSLEHHRSFWLYEQEFPEFMIKTGVQLTPVKFPTLKGETEFYPLRDDKLKIVKVRNNNLIELIIGDVTSTKHSLTEIKINDLLGVFKYHPIP